MDSYTNLMEVRIIRNKGFASLIEWGTERRRRVIIPRTYILEQDSKTYVSEMDLALGIPYGLNWDHHLSRTFVIPGEKIAEQLEASGIWTKEDFYNNPNAVQQAVLGAARDILTELVNIVQSIPHQEE
jgi:hypothetical protein